MPTYDHLSATHIKKNARIGVFFMNNMSQLVYFQQLNIKYQW